MRVPSGTFGALWIGWPWYFIGAIAVGFNGWALEMLVCPAFGVARSAHVYVQSRRNGLCWDSADSRLLLRISGKDVHVESADIVKVQWFHGLWSATFDALANWTVVHVHTRDGSIHVVTLYLARYRDQERALQAVASWLPVEEWEVRRRLCPTSWRLGRRPRARG